MLWTRLHDPRRTPSHWTEIIRPGQFAVFIYDAPGHVARDAEGQTFEAQEGASLGLCNDLAEAVDFAELAVAKHPALCCEIYGHEGKSGEPMQTIYNPVERGKYAGRPFAQREAIWGVAVLTLGAGFALTNYVHHFEWIWGYVLGLKCLLVGGTLLVMGLLGLHEYQSERAMPGPDRQGVWRSASNQ